jgi:hypothetical protein
MALEKLTELSVDGAVRRRGDRSSELSVDAVAAPSTENLGSKLDGVDAVDLAKNPCVHNL